MKCLVTGGAGFIGSHVADILCKEGAQVLILDNLSTGNRENVNPKCEFYSADITQYEQIEPLFKGVDFVFHLAALPRIQPSFEDPILHEQVNVIGAINCFLAAKKCGAKKFVLSSSSACYGNTNELPTTERAPINCLSPYALQKYSAEQYCLILGERFNVPVVALRYFNVYGSRSFNQENPFNAYTSVIGIFHNQKNRGEKLTITGDGEQQRDFIHVYDVANVNLKAALSDVKNDVFNIGCGKSYSVNDIAKLFMQEVVYSPERKGEARITLADISKAKNILKWQPSINLEQGLNFLD
ncbi:NAD-dependent epimerase/dehydratase family protein [Candidatus Peregrinibacteria bacterium]|nr:NAD-dependent epimerase/dehydratase family protein [Candidatus Peregrinibacteria bacterium]